MQPFTRVSEDEYLARERVAETKHELIHGQMVAMAGGSIRHNAMVANLVAALHARLRGKGCLTLPSDQRTHVPATGLYTYPDVTIICGDPQRHRKDSETILNPRVLVEVLSKSTEGYDRGAKFAHYRSIESLQTYLMINLDEPRVERYERGEGVWTLHDVVGEEAILELPALGISVSLGELYGDLPAE
jgi:Uma2 family endonuclease